MRDGAEHVEDQFAGGRGGVDLFLQAEQGDAAELQLFDDGEEFGEGSAEPVEADDCQGVALAGVGQEEVTATIAPQTTLRVERNGDRAKLVG